MRATQNQLDEIVFPAAHAGPFLTPAEPSDPEPLSDDDLTLSLRNASEQETIDRLFEELFVRYHARVVGWCYAVARNHDIAQDLAQEVFLKVFRSLPAFRGDSRMSTWIYVITRNHCLNSIRKRDAEPTDSAAQIPINLEGENGLDAHHALERAQSFENIYRTISSILTPLEIRVLWLHYGHDATLAAITHQLLLTNRSGAKAFIVSAKRKLKLYLHNRGLTSGALNILAGARSSVSRAGKRGAPRQIRAFAA
jgi:RNA polymerase sigma-70 factor (ECF subfamily)